MIFRKVLFFLFLSNVFQTITSPSDLDEMGSAQEPVEDGCCGWDVPNQLSPLLDGAVAGHEGGAVFIAAHDNLEEMLPRPLGKDFEAHVVNDEKIGLQVARQDLVDFLKGLTLCEVGAEIEDGTVKDREPHFGHFPAYGLGQVGFANARRADKEDVLFVPDELSGGELHDLFFWYVVVEREVKVLQAPFVPEPGELDAFASGAIFPDGQFVLDQKFQELKMSELARTGFLHSHFQGGEGSREFQAPQRVRDLGMHGDSFRLGF